MAPSTNAVAFGSGLNDRRPSHATSEHSMRSLLLLTVGGVLLAGCQGSPSSAGNSTANSEKPGAPTALKPADVKLTKGDEKALAAAVAAHKGQVVFVDYWATWCHSCVE